MVEENISQEFRLENIDQTRDYFVEEIEQTELMSRKHKNVCATLNCIEDFLISASTNTARISITAFASLLDILTGITSSAIRVKTCAIAVGIKKYRSIIKKKKKNHDKVVLLAKSKSNSTNVLISKDLVHSNISHDEIFFNK